MHTVPLLCTFGEAVPLFPILQVGVDFKMRCLQHTEIKILVEDFVSSEVLCKRGLVLKKEKDQQKKETNFQVRCHATSG